MDRKYFPEEIQGERIVLKKLQLSLAQTMFDYVDRDRQRLRQFLPWVNSTQAVQDEINFIELMTRKWNEYSIFCYGIFRKSDDVYMGNVDLHSIFWDHDCGEFGYWILGDFEGQGYMSEAVLALERIAFAIGFHRLEVRCSSANQKSASVPLRCGYQLDGRLREDRVEYGKYCDTLVFGKIKTQKVLSKSSTS